MWRSFFLCRYLYPKYKNKQMLYLTSFKIAADFLNNLNFLDILPQVHIKLIFPEKTLFFQSSCWNWWHCKLGTNNFFPFSIDIFGSASFLERYIPNSCFFDSWFFKKVYSQLRLWYGYYFNNLIVFSCDDSQWRKYNIKTWAEVVKEFFREVRTFKIHDS